MKYVVLDSESDGLWEEATKIHVLSYTEDGINYTSTNDYDEMRKVLLQKDVKFVAHNSIRHDLALFNKILGLELTYKNFVDSLALSWYLNFSRGKDRHGIASYGKEYGIPKPEVEDWVGLTYEEYKFRCEEDTKINWRLWKDLESKLEQLYPDKQDKDRLVEYLSFKMDCAREAELVKVRIDLDLCQKTFDILSQQKEEKTLELAKAMPKKHHYKKVTKPKDLYKKDGSLSIAGKKWLDLLVEMKLPHNTVGPIQVIESSEDGKPSSSQQVKEWLFSLGWKPLIYKYAKDKVTGKERAIPQVRYKQGLCESVLELIKKDPAVEILEGLTVVQHRYSVVKGFLEHQKNGLVKATIGNLTNTLRFSHRAPLTNLPGVDKLWGKEIRGCMLPPEKGYVWAGSDMVSLEDNTKRHYMQPLDPDYVEKMMQPGFDPHLDLAVFAGAITQEQADKHMKGELDLTSIRKKYKAANYSCVYGVGKAKLSRAIEVSLQEADKLIQDYWKRNWAVKKVASMQKVKIVGGSMWVLNPVSKFWHSLRSEKDIFSTLNQSTGAYCFDTWVYYTRLLGLPIAAQFHDEQLVPVKIGNEDFAKSVLKDAIGFTNKKLKLNVELDVDCQFGKDYASVH